MNLKLERRTATRSERFAFMSSAWLTVLALGVKCRRASQKLLCYNYALIPSLKIRVQDRR